MAETITITCYASGTPDGTEIVHEQQYLTRGRCACGAYKPDGTVDTDRLGAVRRYLLNDYAPYTLKVALQA